MMIPLLMVAGISSLLYDYPFSYNVKTNSTLMFLVKGTNANVQMRLSVKDTGYEQSPWHTVTLSEDDWQVVSFDLLNDEAEGWITGNGIVEGETVVIEGIHMRSCRRHRCHPLC
ncbi:MAG: hypothetical protein U5N56_11300 [Candidatus Marinimicrobia bacterium]|nr:hypothetical protein [Candidatus Neomarinimicrobiota bacterium]